MQALARSLRVVGSTYPLIVLYNGAVSHNALEALQTEGCELRFTQPFNPEGVDHSEYKRELYLDCE